ncbi:Mini-chromosome maintenance complex-binding protein [Porphyridium purpureum]|uniref:Mini-chromosome maintenance complex-binding protein n=1 Tax=Porphyridium purpureum TaxID=35688 RepID=A0A5J4YLZ5_PORPP|nr:Mini-chromosome maintenance complex-binding protein [Porphyridium purpureum]|eukprot:POR2292..scf244_11
MGAPSDQGRDVDVIHARFAAVMAQRGGSSPAAQLSDVLPELVRDDDVMLAHARDLAAAPLAQLPEGSMVSFTGMIQDVFDQQLFVWRYGPSKQQTTLFSDSLCEMSEESVASIGHGDLAERLPAYVVSIPGQTDWTLGRDETPVDVDSGVITRVGAVDQADRLRKRSLSSEQVALEDGEEISASDARANAHNKRAAGATSAPRPYTQSASTAGGPAASLGLNLPLQEDTAKTNSRGVLIKLYQRDQFDQLLLNQIVRVHGILEYPQQPAARQEADNNDHPSDQSFMDVSIDDADEALARNPPSAPILHVVRLEALSKEQAQPIFRGLDVDSARRELHAVLPSMRTLLASYLTRSLGGDALAAEYLLATLVSGVELRNANVVAGKCVLNLILPEDASSAGDEKSDSSISFDAIVRVVKSLVSRVATFDMSIDALNTQTLTPARDLECNRLRATRLQLADRTYVLVDETHLQQGTLSELGIKNVQTLGQLASRQLVSYDFNFYNTELFVDFPMIVVSRGARSLLPADCRVRVVPSSAPVSDAVDASPSFQELNKMRLALALLSLHDDQFDIPADTAEKIEQHFVAMREAHRQSTSSVDPVDALHSLLNLARVFSRAHGEHSLNIERLKMVLECESNRALRVYGTTGITGCKDGWQGTGEHSSNHKEGRPNPRDGLRLMLRTRRTPFYFPRAIMDKDGQTLNLENTHAAESHSNFSIVGVKLTDCQGLQASVQTEKQSRLHSLH